VNFQNQCSGIEAPRAWLSGAEVTGQSAAGTDVAVGVTEGGLVMITSADARKRRANRQTSFGPTCRLVSSPEAGPGATVGTLKQGYPLLLYEGAVSTRLFLVAWQTTSDPTTRTAPGPPRCQKRQYAPRHQQWVQTPMGSIGPLYVWTEPPGKVQNLHGRARTPGTGLGPPCVGSGPLTTGSRGTGTKSVRTLVKARRGSGANTCPDHTAYASAPRSDGDPMLPRGQLPAT
jgi:hypothetical protein